jgi:heat shock protein HtpX
MPRRQASVALTYTEIEQQKNTRIILFFLIVVLFYFLTAFLLTFVVKGFFGIHTSERGALGLSVSAKEAMVVLFFALAAGGIHILHSMANAMKYVESNLSAEAIDKTDRYHGLFSDLVDEVNVATGSKYKVKPVVIPTVALNAFSMADQRGNAIIGVTEGLLSKLTRQQLEAVVAHEMAHVASGDSLQTTVGCALFGVYAAMAGAAKVGLKGGRHVRGSGRGTGSILLLLLLVYLTLAITQFFYRLIRFALSRERELRADAIAVRLTRDPISLAEALQKISAGWRGIGYIQRDLASLFIINPAVDARDEEEGSWANLQSTHPPIRRRIKILAAMAHVAPKDIEEEVKMEALRKDRAREMPPGEEEPLWRFSDSGGEWQGPFTLSQAMVLGWLTPDTWVKRGTDETPLQAKDEPLLKPVFDAGAAGARVSDLECPACKKKMVEEEYEGVRIKRCAFCDGVLVGWRQLPLIGMRTEKGFDERAKKIAEYAERDKEARLLDHGKQRASPLKCPKCGRDMQRSLYSAVYPVEVDKCLMCGAVWFEKGELEAFQYMLETKGVIPEGWD